MKKLFFSLLVLLFIGSLHAQNVGIGTTNPTKKLDVIGTTKTDTLLVTRNAIISEGIMSSISAGWISGNFGVAATGDRVVMGNLYNTATIGAHNNALTGWANLSINTDGGNVGIGTITPANKLSVTGNADFTGNVGIGITAPNASAILEVSSTTKGFLPPRMTQAERDAITPVEGLIIYNMSSKKPNFYDGIEWKNFNGSSAVFGVGAYYQGGVIFYIFVPGDPGYIVGQEHGLIAAPSDQGAGAQWYNGTNITTGAIGQAIGTGNANTNTIVSFQGAGSYAAKLCFDLVLNGYSDWYLPSKNELNKLYINKNAIGGIINNYYWTSTEQVSNTAHCQLFNNGFELGDYKYLTYRVRAIRTF